MTMSERHNVYIPIDKCNFLALMSLALALKARARVSLMSFNLRFDLS